MPSAVVTPGEHEFRRVEPILLRAFLSHPTPIEEPVPVGLSPETFANRVRTGARRFLFHRFDSSISVDAFQLMWQTCVVSARPSSIIIGIRGSKDSPLPPGPPPSTTLTVNDPTPRIIAALLVLHHDAVLKAPTHLTGTVPDEAIRETIARDNLNVAFDPHPDHGWQLF